MKEINHYLELIETNINDQHFDGSPRSLYEPIRYILSLGGKRLRPMLTLLSYNLYRKDVEKAVPFAVAVEAFHNFTLMHDDIMDHAPLRRGKPTVHEKWNVSTAILSGDVMLVKVYEMLLGLEESKLRRVLALFNACATGVCEGQQWDMEFESRKRVTEKEYIHMIRLKTAVLLGFALELGAVLADAPEKDALVLRDAGEQLGIGFQLKDDLLDVYADKKKFGKQVGGDIIANKKTYLLIHALQQARGADKKELNNWLQKKTFNKRRKVAAVTALYDRLGVRRAAEAQVAEHFNLGFESLKSLSSQANTSTLVSFAEALADRQR